MNEKFVIQMIQIKQDGELEVVMLLLVNLLLHQIHQHVIHYE